MTITIAYIILAHDNPEKVAHLAKTLLHHEDVVAIHYDANAPEVEFAHLRSELSKLSHRIVWADRVRVAWGEWSIVQATINAISALRSQQVRVDYVHLMSGSDYPIRPLQHFKEFLERNSGLQYIECTDILRSKWVHDGLTHERYQYRHYFNWKKHPNLFDKNWKLQKKFRLARMFPEELRPHMGSQWWTITWSCAMVVLKHCTNPTTSAFFRHVWIPDEMLIQTIVGTFFDKADLRPNLTLYQFDDHGNPVVYYDDHKDYLENQPFFFARKISPSAKRLISALDASNAATIPRRHFEDSEYGKRTDEYIKHIEFWSKPRTGVRQIGFNHEPWWGDLHYQDKPFFVIVGASKKSSRKVADLINHFEGFICHGELFNKKNIEFRDGMKSLCGYRSEDIKLRDHNKVNFLRDVLRHSADQHKELTAVGFILSMGSEDHILDRLLWSPWVTFFIVYGDHLSEFAEEYLADQFGAASSSQPVGFGDDSHNPNLRYENHLQPSSWLEEQRVYEQGMAEKIVHANARYYEVRGSDSGIVRDVICAVADYSGILQRPLGTQAKFSVHDKIDKQPFSSKAILDLTRHISDRALKDNLRLRYIKSSTNLFDRLTPIVFSWSHREWLFTQNVFSIMGCNNEIDLMSSAGEDISRYVQKDERGGYQFRSTTTLEERNNVVNSCRAMSENFLRYGAPVLPVLIRGNILRAFREWCERRYDNYSDFFEGGNNQLYSFPPQSVTSDFNSFITDHEKFVAAAIATCESNGTRATSLDLLSEDWMANLCNLLDYWRKMDCTGINKTVLSAAEQLDNSTMYFASVKTALELSMIRNGHQRHLYVFENSHSLCRA